MGGYSRKYWWRIIICKYVLSAFLACSMKKSRSLLSRIALWCIRLYQKTLSPDLWVFSPRLKGTICCHEPHCSEYAKRCFYRYPFMKAVWMSLERISQCTWWTWVTYDPEKYRIVFFSSAPIGIPFLESLHKDTRFDVVGVVTMPDAPIWRWQKMQENIVKSTAKHLWITVQTPASLQTKSKKYWEEAREFFQWVESLEADFLVVIAYGKIIPQSLLDIPRIDPINVHWSLLPRRRWASPIQSVFLANDATSGITVMRMVAELDAWEIIDIKKVQLPFSWTSRELIDWMKHEWPSFLLQTLRAYGKRRLVATPQDEALVTYCSKIDKEDGRIDPWNMPLRQLYAAWRAYCLRPKLFFEVWNTLFIIDWLIINEKLFATEWEKPFLIKDGATWLHLNASVEKLLLKPQGKKAQERKDIRNGYGSLFSNECA